MENSLVENLRKRANGYFNLHAGIGHVISHCFWV